VDFDPVRAKAEGRKPVGMDEETAALFPDSFEDSEMGKIPKGWSVMPIGEVLEAVGGSTPSTSDPKYWGGNVNFATPKDMAPLLFPVLLDTERRISEKGLEQISSGLLPPGTVLMSSRAPIGYLAITEIPVAVNQGFIAMKCIRELPNLYVLHWARENMDVIISNANGTTFLEISKKNFRPIKVVVPTRTVLDRFMTNIFPLHHRLVMNEKESRTLAYLRDTLLPKLLSGEIRVKEAEKVVESVT
jgi:type I restriction enzyme S subunit